jgi:hypothetical protein
MATQTKLRIFLSYSTINKRAVGKLKNELEKYPFECFLAHEDIVPSQTWEKTIVRQLRNCDVFVPILTKEFCDSDWTDQECGIAFALNKFVLPVCYRTDPYGFISQYQALKASNKRGGEIEIARNIVLSLIERKELRNKLRDLLISLFTQAGSWIEAGKQSEFLLKLLPFSDRQMNNILQAAIANNQISGSIIATKNIGKIIRLNQPRVGSPDLLGKYRKIAGS